MNYDLGNKASDLRRIANWLARGQKEKLTLIVSLLEDIKADPISAEILKHFQADIDPKKVINNKRQRMFLAEQMLISSGRLMSMAK